MPSSTSSGPARRTRPSPCSARSRRRALRGVRRRGGYRPAHELRAFPQGRRGAASSAAGKPRARKATIAKVRPPRRSGQSGGERPGPVPRISPHQEADEGSCLAGHDDGPDVLDRDRLLRHGGRAQRAERGVLGLVLAGRCRGGTSTSTTPTSTCNTAGRALPFPVRVAPRRRAAEPRDRDRPAAAAVGQARVLAV